MEKHIENIEFVEVAKLERCGYIKKIDKPIMLSIWCTTYNHESYVKDALEGFIHQKVNFEYEIIVFDDASTDETPDIIRSYVQKYPNLIRAYLAHENTYHLPTRRKLISEFRKVALQGKYIALCEGDDFWLDANKLQIQVDYMEQTMDCMLTVHSAVKFNCQNYSLQTMAPYDREKDISAEELIMWYNGNVPTASMVYRREMLNISGFFLNTPSADWTIQLYCITKGNVHYFDRIMSCYRANVKGSYTQCIWGDITTRLVIRIGHLRFLQNYNKYTKRVHETYITKKIGRIIQAILCEYKDMSIEEFDRGCGAAVNACKDELVNQLKELFRRMKDENYCGNYIMFFLKRYKHIYIMGAGLWGQKLAKKFIQNGLEFDGFVVSDEQHHPQEILEKKVQELSDIPFCEEIGIIVAVQIDLYHQLIESLCEKNIKSYAYLYNLHAFLE